MQENTFCGCRKTNLLLAGIFFCFLSSIVINPAACQTSPECNRYTNTPQCFAGEICNHNHKCKAVATCRTDFDCGKEIFKKCISGFCQESYCIRDGQCVHGQKCSSQGKCTYLVDVKANEGRDVVLSPIVTQNDKLCNEKIWFKYLSKDNYPRLVHLENDKSIKYFGKFCEKNSNTCEESDKLNMNPISGSLIIKDVQLGDEADYYYYCGIQNRWPVYQLLRLETYVAPGKDNIDILGLPDAVESGTNVELTCIVQRIKPLASDIHWTLNGRRLSFIDIEAEKNKDKTHKQFIKLNYRIKSEDNGAELQCSVITSDGEEIFVKQSINILRGPSGKPTITPRYLSRYDKQEVTLTCKTDSLDTGHPICDEYVWEKTEEPGRQFRKLIEQDNTFTFKMKVGMEGKYQCRCQNQYGVSDLSNTAVLWLLDTNSVLVPKKEDMFLKGFEEELWSDTINKFTCSIKNIRTEAIDFYWIVNGQRWNGTVETELGKDAMSLMQKNRLYLKLENKLNMTKVQCIVISEGGKTLKLTKLLNFKNHDQRYFASAMKEETTGGQFIVFSTENIHIIVIVIASVTIFVIIIILLCISTIKRLFAELSLKRSDKIPSDPSKQSFAEARNTVNEQLAGSTDADHKYEYITNDRISSAVYDDVWINAGPNDGYLVPKQPDVDITEKMDLLYQTI